MMLKNLGQSFFDLQIFLDKMGSKNRFGVIQFFWLAIVF